MGNGAQNEDWEELSHLRQKVADLSNKLQQIEQNQKVVSKFSSSSEETALKVAEQAYKTSISHLKWSLGIILTLLFAFIAISVFENKKEYEKAKNDIEKTAKEVKDIKNEAQTSLSRVEKEVDKVITGITSEYKALSKKQFEKLQSEINSKLSSVEEQGDIILHKIRDRGNETLSEIKEKSELLNKQNRHNEKWIRGLDTLNKGEYKESADYWEEVIEIDPNDDDACHNWGICFFRLAEKYKGDKANDFYEKAFSKFERATALDPIDKKTWAVWGNYLNIYAMNNKDVKNNIIYNDAYEKYQKALEIDDKYALASKYWAYTLHNQTGDAEKEEKEFLCTAADEKYAITASLSPDDYELYHNWGNLLFLWAQDQNNENTDNLLKKAYAKYEKALNIKSDYYEALISWAIALLYEGNRKSLDKARPIYEEACQKCKEAFGMNTRKGEALRLWGGALLELASREKKAGNIAKANELLDESARKLDMAVNRDPDHKVFHYLGQVLSWKASGEPTLSLGKNMLTWDDKKNSETLRIACKKYEIAAAIDPSVLDTYLDWGLTLMSCSALSRDSEKEQLMKQAEEKFLYVEDINPGYASYYLACMHAWNGDELQCKVWLMKAEEADELPSFNHAKKSIWLKSLNNKKWFKELSWKNE